MRDAAGSGGSLPVSSPPLRVQEGVSWGGGEEEEANRDHSEMFQIHIDLFYLAEKFGGAAPPLHPPPALHLDALGSAGPTPPDRGVCARHWPAAPRANAVAAGRAPAARPPRPPSLSTSPPSPPCLRLRRPRRPAAAARPSTPHLHAPRLLSQQAVFFASRISSIRDGRAIGAPSASAKLTI